MALPSHQVSRHGFGFTGSDLPISPLRRLRDCSIDTDLNSHFIILCHNCYVFHGSNRTLYPPQGNFLLPKISLKVQSRASSDREAVCITVVTQGESRRLRHFVGTARCNTIAMALTDMPELYSCRVCSFVPSNRYQNDPQNWLRASYTVFIHGIDLHLVTFSPYPSL